MHSNSKYLEIHNREISELMNKLLSKFNLKLGKLYFYGKSVYAHLFLDEIMITKEAANKSVTIISFQDFQKNLNHEKCIEANILLAVIEHKNRSSFKGLSVCILPALIAIFSILGSFFSAFTRNFIFVKWEENIIQFLYLIFFTFGLMIVFRLRRRYQWLQISDIANEYREILVEHRNKYLKHRMKIRTIGRIVLWMHNLSEDDLSKNIVSSNSQNELSFKNLFLRKELLLYFTLGLGIPVIVYYI